MAGIPTFDVYRKLNRVEKGNWTRLSRTFSIAHANKVWSARLAKKAEKK
jgi:hypothetical protein